MSGTWADAGLRVVWTDFPERDPSEDSLRASLVAYWKLDETSGSRLDSSGNGRHLTDTNSNVSSTAGKLGNAALFSAGNQQLTRASDDLLKIQNGVSFQFGLWARFSDLGATGLILYKGPPAYDFSDNFEYALIASTIGPSLAFFNYNSNEVSIPISVDTTYFVEVYFNHVTQKLGIAINNGSFTEVDQFVGDFPSSNYPVFVGNSTVSGNNVFGWIDNVLFTRRLWTQAERNYLWNGGAGRVL